MFKPLYTESQWERFVSQTVLVAPSNLLGTSPPPSTRWQKSSLYSGGFSWSTSTPNQAHTHTLHSFFLSFLHPREGGEGCSGRHKSNEGSRRGTSPLLSPHPRAKDRSSRSRSREKGKREVCMLAFPCARIGDRLLICSARQKRVHSQP
ncbi:hypothetical protein NPIL_498641 [Nephila pilipes]|uniref:Uncharacterized protein n=1 Tax=Nephila pilipes TaxID=299642 RepID=A0A8X6N6P4_NEPPI|nr:hypothetical protein NPIL_498641 [Nephila pilipes]